MTTTIALMQSQETRDTLIKLKARLYDLVNAESDVRKLVYDLYIRKGWQSIGYPSFKACVIAELGTSWQHAYKMVEAEGVIRGSEVLPPDLPTTHAALLSKVPQESQGRVYQEAVQLASTEGNGTPVTSGHIETVVEVEQTRQQVLKSRYFLPGQMMTEGKISPDAAKVMVENIEALAPKLRGAIVEFIAKYDLRHPDLIPKIASDIARQYTADPSRTLQRIMTTRCINNRPISEAGPADYAAEKAFSKAERIAEQQEAERRARGWEARVITIRKGDPAYTARVLSQELSPFDLLAVLAELQGMIEHARG